MHPVRLLAVRYLNTVPLIEGLDKTEGVELSTAVPSKIASLVAGGQADIGLASTFDAAALGVPMVLLPSGMIGCDGPTLTVRLFSESPIERITQVHVDTDSRTSVALCRVLLRKLHGITPDIIEFDARERVASGGAEAQWPPAMLLIGDKVVTDSPPAVRYPHQLDLGEAWKALTGLPFVYAVWMCRRDRWQDPEIGPRLRIAAALLDRQLRHNLTRLDWIISQCAPEHRWPTDLARRYIGELLRFRIGEREREGLSTFLSAAAECGLCPRLEPEWGDIYTSQTHATPSPATTSH
ncbi:MAG: menaquinone biosynthesis protein [Phycisphaerales bacterium]|nr:menaquinone biosynthesis protein [Phycisphaerales bacterium]